MTFALGFMLGFLLACVQPLLTARPSVRRAARPRDDEAAPTEEERRRALREYRNFLTYDGYTDQGGDSQ